MTHSPCVTMSAYPVRTGNCINPLIDGEPAFRWICEVIDRSRARVWASVIFLWSRFQMPDYRPCLRYGHKRASAVLMSACSIGDLMMRPPSCARARSGGAITLQC
jgi:hypothetical protein